MASFDKTSFLQLNQWAADDQVLRADFNADNQKLDAAALYATPVTGTYTGVTHTQMQIITTGFRPSCVLIMVNNKKWSSGQESYGYHGLYTSETPSEHVSFFESGFGVTYVFNDINQQYSYIAYR